MSRQQNLEQAENSQKDIIIASMKKQLYDLKDREHEFIPLQNELTNIQSKYEMLQDEKERIENEHRIKAELNKKNISELRAEIDNIKLQQHKSTVNIDEILRDIAGIRRVNQNRENQISALLATNQEMNSRNDQLGEENRTKTNRIKSLRQDRNKMDFENQKYLKSIEENINLLKILEKEARALESSNTKLTCILEVAEDDHIDLIEEMKNREEVVNDTHKKLDSLNIEIDALRDKTRRLEKDLLKSEQEYRNVKQTLELMINKNKDQAKKIKIYQNELRVIENELDKYILENDALQNDFSMLSAQNNVLNDEIDKVFLQITEQQKMNKSLHIQTQNYILLDEQARKLLNRRQSMLGMLQSVDKRLIITQGNIAHMR